MLATLPGRLALILGAGLVCLGVACSPGPASAPRTTASPAASQPAASAPPVVNAPPAPPATPAPLAVVRLGNARGVGLPQMLAAERGYFLAEGIELERVEFASAADAIAPLSTGDLDAGVGSFSAAFFNALARGIRLHLALDAAHLAPGSAGMPLMVPVAAGGTSMDLTTLRGARVGLPARGVITEWALDRMLAEAGLQMDDTEPAFMTFPDMLPALASGQLQGAVMPEPFATVGELRGAAVRARETSDYLPGAQISVTVFSDRFVRERREVAERFAVAYLRGGREYMAAVETGHDRETVLALLSSASGLDLPVLNRMGHYHMARDGRVNADATLAMLDWLVQRGYVQQKPDVVSLMDPRFAEHASRVLDSRR